MMRIFWVIPLWIVLCVGGAYLYVFKPFYILPSLLHGLKVSQNGFPTQNEELLSRLQKSYPPDTPEDVLVKSLKWQGFKIEGHNAKLRIERFPCAVSWYMSWERNPEQKLSFKFAGGAAVCL
ncbi:MAG: hypothetical protein KDI13_04000 [Alphaproteobacteria bacterium]|nr:hypothetical protein [Alphaproteobacteria bacterium]